MKKITLLLMLTLCAALVSFAQDNDTKRISHLYADALRSIKEMKEEPNCQQTMTVKKHFIVPAIGVVEETIECFAYDAADGEENPGQIYYKPFFIRVKTDARPTTMGVTYEEHLYDRSTNQLIFYFKKASDYLAGEPTDSEERLYLNNSGEEILRKMKVSSQETGAALPLKAEYQTSLEAVRQASDKLVEGFLLLMNR